MSSILLALGWAGAGSGTITASSALWHLAIALALTGAVAWLARGAGRQKTLHGEDKKRVH